MPPSIHIRVYQTKYAMQNYINQLLTDIQNAHRTETDDVITIPKTFEKELEAIENWVAGSQSEIALSASIPPLPTSCEESLSFLYIRIYKSIRACALFFSFC